MNTWDKCNNGAWILNSSAQPQQCPAGKILPAVRENSMVISPIHSAFGILLSWVWFNKHPYSSVVASPHSKCCVWAPVFCWMFGALHEVGCGISSQKVRHVVYLCSSLRYKVRSWLQVSRVEELLHRAVRAEVMWPIGPRGQMVSVSLWGHEEVES